MTPPLSALQKRWLYQATHRGTKEADQILGEFVKTHLHLLSPEEEEELEHILTLPDEDLMNFILRGEDLSDRQDFGLLRRIRDTFQE